MWLWLTAVHMGVRILTAVRDLDPPAGGAEMSLATLLKGVTRDGPYIENAPDYTPLEKDLDEIESNGWSVKVFQSSNRGDVTDLTKASGLERAVCNHPVEDLWSGLAWRLRGRRTGKQHSGLQRKHLSKSNRAFAKWLAPLLAAEVIEAKNSGDVLLGVTQLHWSAGAAKAFTDAGIPYLAFVRDELQFNHPGLYRGSLEGAAAVCGAGQGLLKQIRGVFNIHYGAHVPLPVNYAERFGTDEDVSQRRLAGLTARVERNDGGVPRIAIVGVTPEKGFEFYKRFLPHLQEAWSDAQVDVYGGGAYAVGDGIIYFSNFADQGLFVQVPGQAPRPIALEHGLRFADIEIDSTRNQLVCVREDHRSEGDEATNSVISIGFDAVSYTHLTLPTNREV